MNSTELITKAQAIIEEDYPTSEWEGIIESVLADLNPVAKVLTSVNLTPTIADNKCEIDLTSDITDAFEIVSISYLQNDRKKQLKKLPPFDGVTTGWIREQSKVKIQNLPDGITTIVVDYYQLLTLTAGVFNLPEEHHEIILKGVLAMVAQKEEELDRKQDFFQEYMLAKREMMAKRVQDMEPWYSQVVAPVRMGGK